jgi:hypothetical protein
LKPIGVWCLPRGGGARARRTGELLCKCQQPIQTGALLHVDLTLRARTAQKNAPNANNTRNERKNEANRVRDKANNQSKTKQVRKQKSKYANNATTGKIKENQSINRKININKYR